MRTRTRSIIFLTFCVYFLANVELSSQQNCGQECSFNLLKKELLSMVAKKNPGVVDVDLVKGQQSFLSFIPITYTLRDGQIKDMRNLRQIADIKVRRTGKNAAIRFQVVVPNVQVRFSSSQAKIGFINVAFKEPSATVTEVRLAGTINLHYTQSPCRVTFTNIKSKAKGINIKTREPLPDIVKQQVLVYADKAIEDAVKDILNADKSASCDAFSAAVADL
ncbi:hypothetical protein TKK_0010555 [Trichogramma kaykai]